MREADGSPLLAAVCAAALGIMTPPARATMLVGGGSPTTSDCYVTLDVTGSKAASAEPPRVPGRRSHL
jgi:hypothetical protein